MALRANMDSILAKAKQFMGSSEAKTRKDKIVSEVMTGKRKLENGGAVHTPEEAAAKFMDVLRQEIANSGVSDNVAAAISSLASTGATECGDGTYTIGVYFASNLSRPSLVPERYGGISDLATLYNEGAGPMNQVWGYWHGNFVGSKTVIPGAGFMEAAVATFMGSYADEYNVTGITIDK